MNNYNLYFSNNNINKNGIRADSSIRNFHHNHYQHPSLASKWSSITDSLASEQRQHANNYFKYKNKLDEDPAHLNNNNNNMNDSYLASKSIGGDLKFRTEFVDSKLNIENSLAKLSSSFKQERRATTKKASNENLNDMDAIWETEGEKASELMIDQPKLTADEEMLIVKSKKKCEDWFEKHVLPFINNSNTSSPINDLNDF